MDLREQIAKAMRGWLNEPTSGGPSNDDYAAELTERALAVVQPALDAKDTENALLREQLAELLDYKRYGTDCRHNAHVSMTAFAEKISEKRNALAQRAEAVEHARALEAAIARVNAVHRPASHGDVCVYCASDQRIGYDATWPCDTIRALDQEGTPL